MTSKWLYIPIYRAGADGFEGTDTLHTDWHDFFEDYCPTEEDGAEFCRNLFKLIIRHESPAGVTFEEFGPEWLQEQFNAYERQIAAANPPVFPAFTI